MDQGVHSDTLGDDHDDHRRRRATLWPFESNQGSTMGWLASSSASPNATPLLPFQGSISSSSDFGYNLHTPQDSLPDETLPVESLSGLDGSGKLSERSHSVCADMLDPFVAYQVSLHGMEWFEGASSSQSTGSRGQILDSEGHGSASFVEPVIDMRSWNFDTQGGPQ